MTCCGYGEEILASNERMAASCPTTSPRVAGRNSCSAEAASLRLSSASSSSSFFCVAGVSGPPSSRIASSLRSLRYSWWRSAILALTLLSILSSTVRCATRSASPSSISAMTARYLPGCGIRSSVGSSNTSRCNAKIRSGKSVERISLSELSLPARSTILSGPSAVESTS